MSGCAGSGSESTRPYGTWASPLTAARVTAGALRLSQIALDGGAVYWVEGRASEGGRNVLVRRTADGRIVDATPAGIDVRSRVHEYGGGAYVVHAGIIYASNFADQRLYRLAPGAAPHALTEAGVAYADCVLDERRSRLIGVRQAHAPGGTEPVNTVAAVDIASGRSDVLLAGADFYSDPTVSPDGRHLAWLQWNHPNMPWDGTELWVAPILDDGMPGAGVRVAGGPEESIFQPSWSPDGWLYFVSDRTGWWNLYRRRGTGIEPLHPMSAEFGRPQWTFSAVTYAFIDAQRLAVTYAQHGRWRLALLDVSTGRFDPLDLAIDPLDAIRADTGAVYLIGGSPTEAPAVACLTLASGALDVWRRASPDRIEPAWIAVPEAITYESGAGETVHAFFYPPTSPAHTAPHGERPPLLVMTHGGPTAAAVAVLDPGVQFWTSRGFAVLDVNYRGSTGYGRPYRDRLKGQWGIADVEDVVNGARHLVAQGLVDPDRLAIRGGSAGGYTTLAALAFHDTFRAGASYYGVSDIEVLARDTHKFESRYLDSLIGPYPASRDVYRARSPIHAADRISAALILFQGLEDTVVPPNQSEMMAATLRENGVPVAYVAFAGEQHGFRRAETIVRSLEAELAFYGAIFGFTPADPIEPVTIDNLTPDS